MQRHHSHRPDRSATRRRIVVITVLLALGTSVALAAEWPVFKPGNWTYVRTMTGAGAPASPITKTACVDPTAEQKVQQQKLASTGCQFTPMTQDGNTYRYSATCKVGGMTVKSDSVLVAKSAEAYTITVDSDLGGQKSHEVLEAKRTGPCGK